MNLLIGDNFFKENPSKILGEQSTRKGRFGSDMIVVSGNVSNVQSIDAEPLPLIDITPQQDYADIPKDEAIKQVFENDQKKELGKKVKKIRKQADQVPSGESYTHREIDELYNKNITRDEKEAYYFTHPELNYKLIIDAIKNSKQELISKDLICYDCDDQAWVYVYTYKSGNINRKISALHRDKEKFVSQYGENQWNKQIEMLQSVRPKAKGLIGDDRLILLPHSNFAREFTIEELRYDKPELSGTTSLLNAFKQWLRYIPADNFKKATSREIIDFYLDNKSIPISKDNKEQKAKDEKNAINIRQRTKEEGDLLFAKFLAEELLPEDQAKFSHLWNEKFNSYAEPDLTKIPVCFRIGKMFKQGPLMLNPTQRQAAAFQQEKLSGLFAYGVGVGKTLAAIVCSSQAIENNLARYPMFIVPTNTYDKWIGEIQGYTDKETGVFMHGALPHLPPVVGLFNLNPTLVKEKLKEYSKEDEFIFDSITEAIGIIKKLDVEMLTDAHRKLIQKSYAHISWPGIEAEYNAYIFTTKSAKKKSFKDFVADYLREEYNYHIYSLGKIRSFPVGTIFVTTEVGVQRLGVSDQNKTQLADRLYSILSQGELTAEKDSNRDIAGLHAKIEQTVSSSLKNAKLLVEDFGIDWVCFDESHLYKKLFTFVKGTIVGEKTDYDTGKKSVKRDKSKYELKSGSYPSSRALSAFVLSHFIQANNKNRNVIQLTATPFTNSPLEVFSMLTLTNYRALEDMGLANISDFFDTFMRINYEIKYTPQKTVVKDVVLTGYNNLPQLRQIIYSLMDKKDEGANLKRPVKNIYPSVEKGIETTLPMTAEQDELIREAKKYINGDSDYDEICQAALQEEVESMDFDALEDEPLIAEFERLTGRDYEGERENLSEASRAKIIEQIKKQKVSGMELSTGDLDDQESLGIRVLKGLSMMRQITLSPYLYYKACRKAGEQAAVLPDYRDYVNSSPKFKYVMGCIASVIKWHKDNGTKISGQVIYMNAGIEYFPLLKEYLVKELGLRENQVGMVTGSMGKSAKENVKMRFLSGDILVLIGSSTISVGVDLQNNSTVLYNCYYDWNPTDAAQIEGRIWRQGNRFANVRIVYPQCYNSADPVIFEYLNQKTLRINEIWNRSSGVQELDLRDFNPKELQKKLITDPEELADWEILEESDKIEAEIIFAENRRESLSNAIYSFRQVQQLRPVVINYLNEIVNTKLSRTKKQAIATYNDKIAEIVTKFDKNPDKMAQEIERFKKGRYDHERDPEGKYIPLNYNELGDEKIYADSKKYYDIVQDWTYLAEDEWGIDMYRQQYKIMEALQAFRTNYKDMKSAEERILKPMDLSFENVSDPIGQFDEKIATLREQLTSIQSGKTERIERIKKEQLASAHAKKTVQQRIEEFASANDAMLGPQLVAVSGSQLAPAAEPKQAPAAPAKQKPSKLRIDRERKVKEVQLPQPEIVKPAPAATAKMTIEKQIKALKAAAMFTPDNKNKIDKQIKGLEIALKFAA